MARTGNVISFGVLLLGLGISLLIPSPLNLFYWKEDPTDSFDHPVFAHFLARAKADMAGTYSLPPLPYGYDALEPHISKQIMELHHTKHHQTYITNLNNALSTLSTAVKDVDIPTQIALQSAIKFHGGGHINHSLFWQNLAPAKSAEANPSSAPGLVEAIKKTWGGEKEFKDAFNAALLGIQGSGWGWLVKVQGQGVEDTLRIVTTKDQDPVVGKGEVPVFGVDMWEHAYYLQYLNGKAAYVENIWHVINWKTAEERFKGQQGDAFKVLKAQI